jgi:diadenosine tetraphosphate (Ap4A) HIT family hydrolase
MRLLTRSEYEEYVKKLPPGQCSLCSIDKQIPLGESTHWYWIANISPYWKWHTLLIPKEHVVDMDDLTREQFEDYQQFHRRIQKHLLGLNLIHEDGKPVDQFITMIRTRFDDATNGSTYWKPNHLHVHIVPDKEGVGRFVIDDSAVDVDVSKLAL